MEDINHTCKKHGELTADQVYVYNRKDKPGIHVFCKICKTATSRKWQLENPEKAKKWAIDNKEHIKARQREKKYYKTSTDNLYDGYVRNIIKSIYKVESKDITPEAIELKRKALTLKRAGEDDYKVIVELDKLFNKVRINQ